MRHPGTMRILTLIFTLALPAVADAQAVQPGEWTGKIVVRELSVPGAPAFLLSMAKGKSRSERKCVSAALAAEGPSALLAPDPKANCTISRQQIGNGRYEQVLACPQKKGTPLTVVRRGTYDASGLTGNVVMTGQTPRGAMRFAGDQTVRRTKASCKG